jgi:hypothetical protein
MAHKAVNIPPVIVIYLQHFRHTIWPGSDEKTSGLGGGVGAFVRWAAQGGIWEGILSATDEEV